MDPIDEIDGKKKRRTMLENLQRSSSLFQSKVQKSENKQAEKAQEQKKAEEPQQQEDSTDFSSEFSNQDTSFHSQTRSDVVKNWEDLLDDDDWLEEDEGEDGDYDDDGGEPSEDEDSEDSDLEEHEGENWKPMSRPAFQPRPTGGAPVSQPSTEQKLGFQWGAVQKREPAAEPSVPPEAGEPEPEAPAHLESGVPRLPSESGIPNSAGTGDPSVTTFSRRGALDVSRRGGFSGLPKEAEVFSPRVRPMAKIQLPPRGQLETVDSAIASAARLLIQTPEDEPGYEECVRLLCRFGLGALRLCSRAKIKVRIFDEKGFTTFPELAQMGLQPDQFPVDGAYLVKSKTCLIDRRCLMEKPLFFHPALYYFAHALDHAQGGDEFSSRKAAAVLACFEASCSGFNGADFVDELAAADPVRYFARSVAIYLGRDDCSDPIWTHQDLIDFDRSMYDYLQYLFARFTA